jgi:hypothetical protein
MLVVDVGTNAEIVLGNKDRLLACLLAHRSRLRGRGDLLRPARRARRHRAHPHRQGNAGAALQGDRLDEWSDEPGFDEKITANRRHRHLRLRHHRGGRRDVSRRHHHQDGMFDGSAGGEKPAHRPDGPHVQLCDGEEGIRISFTQNDIRAIQLAKAALYAGMQLLMDKLGSDPSTRIRLAGAFGSYIDVKYAMILGLIPDCDLSACLRRRQCGRHGRAHGAAQPRLPPDEIEETGAQDREDRNRAGAEVPGALRQRHGPAQQGRSQ